MLTAPWWPNWTDGQPFHLYSLPLSSASSGRKWTANGSVRKSIAAAIVNVCPSIMHECIEIRSVTHTVTYTHQHIHTHISTHTRSVAWHAGADGRQQNNEVAGNANEPRATGLPLLSSLLFLLSLSLFLLLHTKKTQLFNLNRSHYTLCTDFTNSLLCCTWKWENWSWAKWAIGKNNMRRERVFSTLFTCLFY